MTRAPQVLFDATHAIPLRPAHKWENYQLAWLRAYRAEQQLYPLPKSLLIDAIWLAGMLIRGAIGALGWCVAATLVFGLVSPELPTAATVRGFVAGGFTIWTLWCVVVLPLRLDDLPSRSRLRHAMERFRVRFWQDEAGMDLDLDGDRLHLAR